MHAAEKVTWALGDIDRSETAQWWTGGSSIVANEEERKFFEDVGQKLFKENMKVVEKIKNGEAIFGLRENATPKEIDQAWVRFEQGIVQDELDRLKNQNPSFYRDVVDLANASMRELRTGTIAGMTNPSQAEALDYVDKSRRGKVGYQSWDFSNIMDRVAMGDAATALMRQRLGMENDY